MEKRKVTVYKKKICERTGETVYVPKVFKEVEVDDTPNIVAYITKTDVTKYGIRLGGLRVAHSFKEFRDIWSAWLTNRRDTGYSYSRESVVKVALADELGNLSNFTTYSLVEDNNREFFLVKGTLDGYLSEKEMLKDRAEHGGLL